MAFKIAAIITTLFCASTSFANDEIARIIDADYPLILKAMSGTDLSLEHSRNFVTVGWHCGSDFAKQTYDKLAKGERIDNIQIKDKSPDCQRVLRKLSYSWSETNYRLNQRAVQAGIKRREFQYSQFGFSAAVKFDQPVIAEGNIKCLELGRPVWKKFADNPTYPPFTAMGAQEKVATNRCEIAREVNGPKNLVTCSDWAVTGEFDVKTNVVLLGSSLQRVFNQVEDNQWQKNRQLLEQRRTGKASPAQDEVYTKLLNEILHLQANGGYKYQAVLSINLTYKTAKMELIGELTTNRNEHSKDSMYLRNTPTSCRITAPVELTVTDVTAGGVFYNRIE